MVLTGRRLGHLGQVTYTLVIRRNTYLGGPCTGPSTTRLLSGGEHERGAGIRIVATGNPRPDLREVGSKPQGLYMFGEQGHFFSAMSSNLASRDHT